MDTHSYSENLIQIQESFNQLGTETAFGVLAKAQALAKKGKDVINLGIGQPDRHPPQHVIEACQQALKDGHHGYTPSSGIPQLREAVARYYNDLYHLSRKVSYEQVMIVPGGKVTMYQAIMLFGGRGREIVYPNPGFPIYGSMIHFTGAKPVPYRLEEGDNFRPNVERILDALSDKTSLLILNNPSNPTGGLMAAEDVDLLAEALKSFPHVMILSDEIYARLIFDQKEYRSFLSYDDLRDRLIVLDGWSKTYAMTGWRVGMAVWPERWFEVVNRLVVNSHSCVNAPAQWGALAALCGPQDDVEEMKQNFQRRRDLVVKTLQDVPQISCNVPEGAFYAFLNIKQAGLGHADAAQDYLLEKCGVALISGNSFGPQNDDYLRMSFAASDADITKALDRLIGAVNTRG